MSERIDSYLAELDRQLRGKVSDELREARITEMRGHLHLSVRDLISSGIASEDAEKEALHNLGSAGVVAGDFVRQARGYGRKSAWLLSIPQIAILLAIAALAISFVPFQRTLTFATLYVCRWAWLPVFLMVAWQVWKTKRWLVGPIAIVTCALYLIPGIVYRATHITYMDGNAVVVAPAGHLEEYRDLLHSQLSSAKLRLRFFEKTYAKVKSGGQVPMSSEGPIVVGEDPKSARLIVFGGPVSVSRALAPSYSTHPENVSTLEATDRWQKLGPKAIESSRASVGALQNAYDNWRSGPPTKYADFAAASAVDIGLLMVNTGLLLALNWMLLHLGDRARASANKRHALLA